ncbi:FtsX-like permease family protein [Nocardioides alcanivorans]|uniref:FtsX-like permease family protein n=1 Tax=Nocardioides alcanivorans TaxID=2897352 RepID=UPI001F183B39|nr:ABC transporter permease [Nocardioides alcanivorans]
MRSVLLASLRRHTRRYVAAAVAIVIGVAFIVTTSALSSGARNGMVSGLDAPFRNADVAISDIDGAQAGVLLDRAEAEGAEATVLGWTWLPVDRNGEQITDGADIGAIAAEPGLRWQELTAGRFPEADDEAVVDTNAAKRHRVRIDDVLTLGSGATAHDVTVVGTVDSPSALVWTNIYVTEHQLRTWLDQAHVNSVAWAGAGSVDEQISHLEGAGLEGARIQSTDDFVDEQHNLATNGVDVIAIVLLLFAAIALLTSAMVIANTFSILFAQRSRDFALLRCVGATRRQVLRSIRVEALTLGVAASLLGLVAGTGIGFGLIELIQHVAPSARMGDPEISLPWYAAAFTTGLVIAVGAAWLPTRRAVRVSPLAALRPDTGIDARSAAGRVQLGLGIAFVVTGAAALVGAVAGSNVMLMVLGGAASSVGVVVLGPTIVPALIRVLGRPIGRLAGSPGRLAAGNAVRNPRRTAATTASLLVGVTLTTAVLTGLATGRSSLDHEMDVDHPLDAAITATDGEALAPEVAAAVARLKDVEFVVALSGVRAEIEGFDSGRLAAPDAAARRLLRSDVDFAAPKDDEIHLPASMAAAVEEIPEQVTVTVGDSTRTLRPVVGDDWGGTALVSPATLAALTDDPAPRSSGCAPISAPTQTTSTATWARWPPGQS